MEPAEILHLPVGHRRGSAEPVATLDVLHAVPEEEVWLAGQLSPHTRRAYRQDVRHFIATMGVRSADEMRKVNRAAVVEAWPTLPADVRKMVAGVVRLTAKRIAP